MCKQKTNERLWLEEWLSEYYPNEDCQIKPLFVCLSPQNGGLNEITEYSDNVIYYGRVSGSDESQIDIDPLGAMGGVFMGQTYVDLNQNLLFHSLHHGSGFYLFQGYAIIFNNPLFAISGRRPEK